MCRGLTSRQCALLAFLAAHPPVKAYRVTQPGHPSSGLAFLRRCHLTYLAWYVAQAGTR